MSQAPKNIFEIIQDEVQFLVSTHNYYSALLVTLSLPAICASIDSGIGSTQGRDGELYRKWLDEHTLYKEGSVKKGLVSFFANPFFIYFIHLFCKLLVLFVTYSMEGKISQAQSMNQSPDTYLIEQIIKGDKNSYQPLVERYKGLVYHTALRMLGDFDSAEDAAQEAFILAYKNLGRLKNVDNFAPWLAGITNNVCRTIQRERKI